MFGTLGEYKCKINNVIICKIRNVKSDINSHVNIYDNDDDNNIIILISIVMILIIMILMIIIILIIIIIIIITIAIIINCQHKNKLQSYPSSKMHVYINIKI